MCQVRIAEHPHTHRRMLIPSESHQGTASRRSRLNLIVIGPSHFWIRSKLANTAADAREKCQKPRCRDACPSDGSLQFGWPHQAFSRAAIVELHDPDLRPVLVNLSRGESPR